MTPQRTIEFRVWDGESKKMIFWTLNDLVVRFNTSDYTQDDKPSPFFKWMQYTGLKDKNGKKIFEGDIVKVGTKRQQGEKNEIAEIRYYRGGFVMFLVGYFGSRDIEMFDGDCKKHEIIGNVYENSELIK